MQSAQSNMSMYAGRKRRRPVKRLTPTTGEVKTNPSKRHRDRLNTELDTLASLLPLDEETVSKLDKLSILRLCVSYLRNKSYFKAIPNKHVLRSLTDITRPAIEAPSLTQPAGVGQTQSNSNQFEVQCKQEGKENGDWTDLISTEEGQMLIQALNGFVIVVQQDGQIFYVSNTIHEYLGFQDADIMHQCIFELIHKDDRLAFQQQMSTDPIITMSESGEQMSQELQPATSINSVKRNFECRFRCLLDESSGFLKLKFTGKLRPLYGQRVRGKDGIPVDKEPPELALFALACPVEQYSIVEIHIRNTIFRTKHDLSFQPMATDKMGIEALGYSEVELIQLPGYHYIHYEDLIYLSDLHSNLLRKGEIPYCYFRLYRKTGKWMWVQVKPRLMYKNDQPDYIVSTHRPMSDDEGEQHHKQRAKAFKFPFKTSSSLYNVNQPYPPFPQEIIDYINNGFKPKFGCEGGAPMDFGAMGPPPGAGGPPQGVGGRPPGMGSHSPGMGSHSPGMGAPPRGMPPQNSSPQNVGMPSRNVQPPVAVVPPRNLPPPNASMPPRNVHMQPPNGLGCQSIVTASAPDVTTNRVDTVRSFMGPDGVQNTILQTQVTRCANEIEKLKIPDPLGFGADFDDDMMQVASMISDQMLTGQLELADAIPTFSDTIMPLERITDITALPEPLSSQEDQIRQFSNADVPKSSAPVSCMQDAAQNHNNSLLESKEMLMYQNVVENGDMNLKKMVSFPNNCLSNQPNFQQPRPKVDNSLQNQSNLFPDGNFGQNTGLTSGSKLHDMLTSPPLRNARQHASPSKSTNDRLKRERTHTVEYLPNSLANSAPRQMNQASLQNIKSNLLTEQGRLMPTTNYQGVAPVVSVTNQVLETPGNHGMVDSRNKRVLFQPNFNQGTLNMDTQMSSNTAPFVENPITMGSGVPYMTSVGNQRIMNAGDPYGIVPENHGLNRPELNQMLTANNQFGNKIGTGVMRNEMQTQNVNPGYHMMNGNQGMRNHGIGNLQNQRMALAGNPSMMNSGNQQEMMNVHNQGISGTGNHPGMMIIGSQQISVNQPGMVNVANQGIENPQGMYNSRTHSVNYQGMMNAKNQEFPATVNNPVLMGARVIPDTGNQLGMRSGIQGIPVDQNPHRMARNQAISNSRTQGFMNSRSSALADAMNPQGIAYVQNQGITTAQNHGMMMNVRNQGIPNIGNQGFANVGYQGIGNSANQNLAFSGNQGMIGSGEMEPAGVQPEPMDQARLAGNNIAYRTAAPGFDEQRQKMYGRIAPVTDVSIYNEMQKLLQVQNNHGMNNVDMVYNKQMDVNNMRMQGQPVSRPSTDSGGTAYNSPLGIYDYCNSDGMQVTPNSVFSSPSGSSGSPSNGLPQHAVSGENCQTYY